MWSLYNLQWQRNVIKIRYYVFCFFLVLTHSKRYSFFMPILPCLVAFCQAFPPLYEDVAALLVQVGQVCASDVATKSRDIDPLLARKYSKTPVT